MPEIRIIDVPVTVLATPDYSAGDSIGAAITSTALTISDVARRSLVGTIKSVILADSANQKLDIDVVFFKSAPTASTFVDNAAITIAQADLEKIVGCVSIVPADYKSYTSNAVAVKSGLDIPFKCDTDRSMRCALIARTTINFAGADDLHLQVGVLVEEANM